MGAEQSRPVPAWNPRLLHEPSDDYEASVRHSLQQQGMPGLTFDQHSTRYPSADSLHHARPGRSPDSARSRSRRHRALTEASRAGGGQAPYLGGPTGLAAGGGLSVSSSRPRRHRSVELMSPTFAANSSHTRMRHSSEQTRQHDANSERLPTYEEATSEQALMQTAMAASRGDMSRFDVIDNSGAFVSRTPASSLSPSPNRARGHRKPVLAVPDRNAAASAPAAIVGLRRPGAGQEDSRTRSRRGMTVGNELQRVNHHTEPPGRDETGSRRGDERVAHDFTPRPLRRSTFSMIEEMRDQGRQRRREGYDMVVEMMDEEDDRRRRQQHRHKDFFGNRGSGEQRSHSQQQQFWTRLRGEDAGEMDGGSAESQEHRLRELQRQEASKAYQKW